MERRSVLIVAYYFPPLGLSGVQRTLKFVKYLPEYGWDPTVLTVDDRGYFAKDHSLLEDLEGREVQVIRTASMDPLHMLRRRNVVPMPSTTTQSLLGKISQTLFVPDNKIGWKRRAVAAGLEELRRKQYDVIFATAPPYTDFLIGTELKRRTGVPLVLDYRDAWVANPLHFYATPLHRLFHRRMEDAAVRAADHVVAINRRIKEETLRGTTTIRHQDISIIPQGFDEDDFAGKTSRPKDGTLRIAYTGTLYYNRTPVYLFRALRRFFDEVPGAASRVEVTIAGTVRDEYVAMAASLGLRDTVRFTGYLPHAESVQLLLDSDVLWLMIGSGPGDTMMSTGKVYEYLGARRTILATVPEGEARTLLERSGAGAIAPPEDVSAIAGQLATLYHAHKHGRLPVPSEQFVAQFRRRELTGRLATVFARVLHLGPHETRVITGSTTHID